MSNTSEIKGTEGLTISSQLEDVVPLWEAALNKNSSSVDVYVERSRRFWETKYQLDDFLNSLEKNPSEAQLKKLCSLLFDYFVLFGMQPFLARKVAFIVWLFLFTHFKIIFQLFHDYDYSFKKTKKSKVIDEFGCENVLRRIRSIGEKGIAKLGFQNTLEDCESSLRISETQDMIWIPLEADFLKELQSCFKDDISMISNQLIAYLRPPIFPDKVLPQPPIHSKWLNVDNNKIPKHWDARMVPEKIMLSYLKNNLTSKNNFLKTLGPFPNDCKIFFHATDHEKVFSGLLQNVNSSETPHDFGPGFYTTTNVDLLLGNIVPSFFSTGGFILVFCVPNNHLAEKITSTSNFWCHQLSTQDWEKHTKQILYRASTNVSQSTSYLSTFHVIDGNFVDNHKDVIEKGTVPNGIPDQQCWKTAESLAFLQNYYRPKVIEFRPEFVRFVATSQTTTTTSKSNNN